VAPDKIERIYLKTGLLEEVFIHGTSIYTFAVAICTPNRERISKIAANVGVEGSWEEICMSKTVRMTVLGYLNAFAR
jgi:long-chain acyl-CoA synthetase